MYETLSELCRTTTPLHVGLHVIAVLGVLASPPPPCGQNGTPGPPGWFYPQQPGNYGGPGNWQPPQQPLQGEQQHNLWQGHQNHSYAAAGPPMYPHQFNGPQFHGGMQHGVQAPFFQQQPQQPYNPPLPPALQHSTPRHDQQMFAERAAPFQQPQPVQPPQVQLQGSGQERRQPAPQQQLVHHQRHAPALGFTSRQQHFNQRGNEGQSGQLAHAERTRNLMTSQPRLQRPQQSNATTPRRQEHLVEERRQAERRFREHPRARTPERRGRTPERRPVSRDDNRRRDTDTVSDRSRGSHHSFEPRLGISRRDTLREAAARRRSNSKESAKASERREQVDSKGHSRKEDRSKLKGTHREEHAKQKRATEG